MSFCSCWNCWMFIVFHYVCLLSWRRRKNITQQTNKPFYSVFLLFPLSVRLFISCSPFHPFHPLNHVIITLFYFCFFVCFFVFVYIFFSRVDFCSQKKIFFFVDRKKNGQQKVFIFIFFLLIIEILDSFSHFFFQKKILLKRNGARKENWF